MAKRFDIHTTDFGWNRAPAAGRVLAWLAVVGVIGLIAQAVVWLAGSQMTMLSSKGRTVLIVAALATAGFIMSRARRSPEDYGLAVSDRWPRHLMLGAAMGLMLAGAMIAAALLSGAATISQTFAWPGWFTVVGSIITAMLLSAVAAFLLTGFVAGELRQQHRAPLTTLLAAAAAVPAVGITLIEDGFDTRTAAALVSVALACAALVQMRLITGDLTLPLGALSAGLCVERLSRKTSLLTAEHDAALAWLAAPDGNPRVAPLLWLLLTGMIVVQGVVLARRPTGAVVTARAKGPSRSFKRFYPLGTMGGLATLDVWLPQLIRARCRVGLIYVPRLIVTLLSSAINTVLTLPERLILPRLYRDVQIQSPVFILGAHRSGTTHLQNLLALDRQLITPRAHQVLNPWGWRFSGLLLWPLLVIGTPWKRPMDAVAFGLTSANEEEYAIANLSGLSPDWSVRLPRLWDDYERFADPARFSPREKARWKRVFHSYLQRLVRRTGRRPMLKNPYNTGRVALLRELYPDAKFIHIHRHPFDTYRSNLHMQAEAHCLFELQPGLDRERFAAWFLDAYRAAEERFYTDTADLNGHQVIEVRFEDLERDALGQVRRVYQALGLAYTDAFDAALREYLAGLGDYRKNTHKPLPDDQRDAVLAAMGPMMERWGYTPR